ncbi:MAG: UDP-N-acetylmuramoyl-tripeptide--D-alanyl-D-alanine ligase [Deltaproteobacteria bacterium]|nr:UDP-N-acetylmuramoyl-tripeptide--D-alanyl-D-alanine ligase [Deltaproteobacteria bacterium]
MRFNAEQIAAATGGEVLRPGGEGAVLTDTRALSAEAWYLALRGERFDGHDFLDNIEHAVGCVVDRELPEGWGRGAVRVSDTTRALQDLGRAARARLTAPVVALTGSSGKTTTRSLIHAALSQMGAVHQTGGNLNNHLGVPMTLLAAPLDADAVVVEMGTSSPGEIDFLARIAQPDVRLIVNVGPAHLQELGGLAGVAREKGAIFSTARAGDLLVVNLDDPFVRRIPRPAGTRVLSWGVAEDADIRLVSSALEAAQLGTVAVFETPVGRVTAHLQAPGEHVAHDAGAALAVALGLGLDLHRAAADMSAWRPVGMRLRREPLPRGATALNDAYNANPASMISSLRTLASLPGVRVAVIGDMLELGAGEADWHQAVIRDALALGLDQLVVVGARMAAAAHALGVSQQIAVYADPLDAAPSLCAALTEAHVVLFKGSRGTRVERVLQMLQAEDGLCSTT